MNTIHTQTFDEERALYASKDIHVINCRFEGPNDGESAFKECRNIQAENCYFDLRYPFWHDQHIKINNCQMTERCRAALWYSSDIEISNSQLNGIKALRECQRVLVNHSSIISPEFGWFTKTIHMNECSVEGEYFMMLSDHLQFNDVTLKGKYSFQYITDSIFENCTFDTKDAFWHAKNILVKNSTIKGEYLAWYSENITFENCKIIGTQPLCYCKGLKLINCEMTDTDLSFEKSEVEATLTAPILSIKNPLSGFIQVSAVHELIMDDPNSSCKIETLSIKGEQL